MPRLSIAACASLLVHAAPSPAAADQRAWLAADAPTGLQYKAGREAVVVAIVDDGFRLSHEALAGFIWQNPLEIRGNGADDDGNGFPDDVNGWDVSDGDNDVSLPYDRLEHYAHGT